MKNSISRKLSLQVAINLAVAFSLLLTVSYLSLDKLVRLEGTHYAKALVTFYSDMVVHESYKDGVPVDEDYVDALNLIGDYVCKYYRIDYLYIYEPKIEKDSIMMLSLSRDREIFGENADDHMNGRTIAYEMSPQEISIWEGNELFSVEKNRFFGEDTDVRLCLKDEFGNRYIAGASVSNRQLVKEVRKGFLIAALSILLIMGLVVILIHRVIANNVSKPAKIISRHMKEYISEGKRSQERLDTGGDDEFAMISDSFNRMSDEITSYVADIKRLVGERERQKAETDIASEIQKGFLPAGHFNGGNCSIDAIMKPAKEIGGDLYDYMELDSSRTMVVVADVSGKGISAAMVMAVTLILIHQFANLGYSPANILKNVNDSLSEKNPRMFFVTAFIAIYDSVSNTLTYANAGHNPPYLIHSVPQMLEGSDGTPLGLFRGEAYEDKSVTTRVGDRLFLYTDGVNEAVGKDSEFYGTDRLESALLDCANRHCTDWIGSISKSLNVFVGDGEPNDDITMLILQARKCETLLLNYDVRSFARIKDCILASGLPYQTVMDLCVAAEECFVNICSYAFDGPAPEGEKIRVSLDFSDKAVIAFSDGGRQFDPREGVPDAEDYDIDSETGGLGRLIAFSVADSVDYEYTDGRNILTLTKQITEQI